MTDLNRERLDLNNNTAKYQRLRLKRFKLAIWTYVVVFIVTLLISFLSGFKVGFYHWIFLLLAAIAGNFVFYFAFITGFNLKFHDKSLTKEQIIYAGLWAIIGAYLVPEYRSIVLMYFLPAFSFGMLRLTIKQYLSVVSIIMFFYTAMLITEYNISSRKFDLVYEIYLLSIFGIILTWFGCFGGMVSKMREKLKKRNRQINEANRKLTLSQERFNTVLNGIDATIYVSDIETNEILFMNRYMIKVFGKDMTGSKCYEAFYNENKKCDFCRNNQLIDENGNPKGMVTWQRKNSFNGRWYNNYDRAITWIDGRIVKIQIATDITDFKRMEEELRHSQKMESVITLAGGIAHDFNNILSIIIGNSDLALYNIEEKGDARPNIKEIKTACIRARDVVAQLLSFSRKREDEKREINIVTVIIESLKFIKSSLPENIEIKENINEKECYVFADLAQINQILINLCTNSIQAMSDYGGLIEVSLDKVDIEDERIEYSKAVKGRYARIIVKDTGSGIESENREKIFDPYFTTKDIGEGSGMGLSVVHGIVKNHRGFIYSDGGETDGTAFTILLPLVNEKRKKEKENDMADKPLGTERILFVDDEESLVKMGERALSLLGYKVSGFTDPSIALREFKNNPENYDIVITDMTMPNMTGVKFTEKLKEIRRIPVIICTGFSPDFDEKKAKELGIAGFAMKPVTMGEVAQKIRKIFDV